MIFLFFKIDPPITIGTMIYQQFNFGFYEFRMIDKLLKLPLRLLDHQSLKCTAFVLNEVFDQVQIHILEPKFLQTPIF